MKCEEITQIQLAVQVNNSRKCLQTGKTLITLTLEDSNLHQCRRGRSVSTRVCHCRGWQEVVSNAYNAATNPDGCIQLGLADNQVGSLPMHPPCVFMGKINQGPSLPPLIFCLMRAAVLRPSHHQTATGSDRIPTRLCGLPGFQGESSISPGKESAACIFLLSNLNHPGDVWRCS